MNALITPNNNLIPQDFVNLSDIIPDAIYDLRYYTDYNFVGTSIDGYGAPVAMLTEKAAIALKKASNTLRKKGYLLKIYDCYRPQRAVEHFMRWANDPVAEQMKSLFYPEVDKSQLFELGYLSAHSSHTRGSTVDLTLVQASDGAELDMGGAFDYFGESSHTFFNGLTEAQLSNRLLLRSSMTTAGFIPLEEEWWHFTLSDEPYPDTYFDFPIQ